jgi:glycosyltransferase involved in cell wall biosynthesis
MRILVCNTFGRLLGGVESYLDRVIPALADGGHEVAMLCEMNSPAAHPMLHIPGRKWSVSEIGAEQALHEVRDWQPEIIYTHAMRDPVLELAVMQMAPALVFAHDYSVTCISGAKRFAFPTISCCSRQFGAGCLVNYLPRRCGGLSLLTMWRNFHRQLTRLELRHRYRRVVVASEAMRQEYLRHGFEPSRVVLLPHPVIPVPATHAVDSGSVRGSDRHHRSADRDSLHLLFAGRMVSLKGGEMLLRALPLATQKLQRPLKLMMVGNGPAKTAWEKQAQAICARNGSITVEFTGWLGQADLHRFITMSDLLVVPSLWPEPFAMIGPEAGSGGLPAAAFAVGGIPEWLHDGVNGFLAPAEPASASGLAIAIAKCLEDPLLYRRLRNGAQQEAMKYRLDRHVSRLLEIFSLVVAEARDISLRANGCLPVSTRTA